MIKTYYVTDSLKIHYICQKKQYNELKGILPGFWGFFADGHSYFQWII